ncbi:glycine-rich domain-containing protein [Streptomyces pristinaespiralis]|uniref:glycine-rich domain-containing protein n=1 Tax=Streptomyces pristinaespiralis TaxID=38300 RepID=UPI0037B6CB5E
MSVPPRPPVPDPPGTPIPTTRELIGGHFDNVRKTVLDANPRMSEDLAGRIVDEGIKFVTACAQNPGVGMAPSRAVDEGWHALLLHSALYGDLCDRFGSFVHHYPGWDPSHYDPVILDRTQELIARAGFDVDPDLWGPPGEGLVASVSAKCQHAPNCAIRPMPKPEWP